MSNVWKAMRLGTAQGMYESCLASLIALARYEKSLADTIFWTLVDTSHTTPSL